MQLVSITGLDALSRRQLAKRGFEGRLDSIKDKVSNMASQCWHRPGTLALRTPFRGVDQVWKIYRSSISQERQITMLRQLMQKLHPHAECLMMKLTALS